MLGNVDFAGKSARSTVGLLCIAPIHLVPFLYFAVAPPHRIHSTRPSASRCWLCSSLPDRSIVTSTLHCSLVESVDSASVSRGTQRLVNLALLLLLAALPFYCATCGQLRLPCYVAADCALHALVAHTTSSNQVIDSMRTQCRGRCCCTSTRRQNSQRTRCMSSKDNSA
jgi:hypothetical protein